VTWDGLPVAVESPDGGVCGHHRHDAERVGCLWTATPGGTEEGGRVDLRRFADKAVFRFAVTYLWLRNILAHDLPGADSAERDEVRRQRL
jgi:hypothetical protein